MKHRIPAVIASMLCACTVLGAAAGCGSQNISDMTADSSAQSAVSSADSSSSLDSLEGSTGGSGIFAYSLDVDSSSIGYRFQDVTVRIPKGWFGDYLVTQEDDRHISFRHKQSFEDLGDQGGLLFTVNLGTEQQCQEYLDYLNADRIGSCAQGTYFLSYPTDYQGSTEHEETAEQYRKMYEELSFVRENTVLTAEETEPSASSGQSTSEASSREESSSEVLSSSSKTQEGSGLTNTEYQSGGSGLWAYTLYDTLYNQEYHFEEVTVILPQAWLENEYLMVQEGKGVTFYHKESHDKIGAGRVFTIAYSENTDYQMIPNYTEVGTVNGRHYYLEFPSDVQTDPENESMTLGYMALNQTCDYISAHTSLNP